MIEIGMAIAVVVGVVAAADLLLTFAVIRRLAALEARGGPARPGDGQSPAVGHRIGAFSVNLISGGTFGLADLSGQEAEAIVVFVMPSCEPCKAALADLSSLPGPLRWPLYVLIAGAQPGDELTALIDDLPAGTQVALIATMDDTTDAFGIDGFPTALGIEDGIVRANELKVSRLLELASH